MALLVIACSDCVDAMVRVRSVIIEHPDHETDFADSSAYMITTLDLRLQFLTAGYASSL